MAKEKAFYVGIENPITLRKDILGGSKELILTLQKYEAYKVVQKEKHAEVAKFKTIMGEMNSLLTRIKTHLPAIKIHKLPKIAVDRYKPVSGKVKPAPSKAPNTELDRLEDELRKIEGKLGDL